MNRSRSEKLFEEAVRHIPGGVNSPVRAFKGVGGTPVFFGSAKGPTLVDEDGNRYIDYVGSWGPMILGHAFEKVTDAICAAAVHSTSFGAPTERETEMAKLLKGVVPGLELVRMVNSGTEACMAAIRLARAFTGKSKIIKFEGCYHGHADSFLIKAGSGASTLGIPTSAGVSVQTAGESLVADYNYPDSVEKLVDEHRSQIAALIVEPVAGNMGCIPPHPDFLITLRNICDREKIVLIFDEVMTGFRVALGGAQERYDVRADLVTFGKIIGAGMPVGAYGGKKEIMNLIAPAGPVYQAGTLSGNPLAMAAGISLLTELTENPGIYDSLEEKGTYLEHGLLQQFEKKQIPIRINRVGSMISLHFSEKNIDCFSAAAAADNDKFARFFHGMLKRGIYLPPSAYETWFISNSHETDHLDRTIGAVSEVLDEL
jgi:glutamate-1-semialdehyde 2,1-aminomutase